MSIIAPRRPILSVLALAAGAATLLSACGTDEAERPLTGLVIPAASIPGGYTVVPAQVDDLVAGNRETLEQASSVEFTPAQCAPTADAAFTPQLTDTNTVLLVAQSEEATLSEVVSTARRDVDADRRATTGMCRVVTAAPSTGSLAGARIVTTTSELPAPGGDAVEQALVVRSDSVTTLAGGGVRVRSALLSNVLVRRPGGEIVTVQLNVGSSDPSVQAAAPEQISPPMPEDEYLGLVDEAVQRAAG
ncbi:hypothetical protein [Gordonia caeni]|uniref:DUF5642 domain-containing protein n=1 Tax=Gordonia caeni TaxID=1007097 RepID=A0ABP7PRD6_9ACTN